MKKFVMRKQRKSFFLFFIFMCYDKIEILPECISCIPYTW